MPHPVVLIGKAILSMENLLRKIIKNEKIAGIILTFSIVSSVYIGTYLLIYVLFSLNKTLGYIISIWLISTTISAKGLKKAAIQISTELKNKNIKKTRMLTGEIVGRDTNSLKEDELIRTTIESVAENTVDGVIAPVFYSFLGGAPLALAYRAINTLDSMVGYKNARYIKFGWASAKLDDLANFIPARIAAFLIPAAAFICKKEALRSLKTILRDRLKHPSPNSGIPEAGIAGALGVRLGGLNFYEGRKRFRPYIGDSINSFSTVQIKETVNLCYIVSIMFIIVGTIFIFFVIARRP
ncbi:MAG: cobalamin biosynthesis protein CobD [Actinobacteria bacterium]|nr:cobalamin biosynthesis protein CobD [Actinomycetota bacterium]